MPRKTSRPAAGASPKRNWTRPKRPATGEQPLAPDALAPGLYRGRSIGTDSEGAPAFGPVLFPLVSLWIAMVAIVAVAEADGRPVPLWCMRPWMSMAPRPQFR